MAHIVVVDDEKIILQMLKILLVGDGHSVVAISEGQKALEYIGSSDPMDILITDLRMDTVNGLDVLKAAHESRPGTPAIVLSAYYSDASVRQAEGFGCRAFVRKPFSLDEITSAISQVLGDGVMAE